MGFLLKIALFGLALYAAWKTFSRWKGLYDRFVGKPDEPKKPPAPPPQAPPPPAPQPSPPQPSRRIAEDTQACSVCGAFFAAGASRCERSNCPLPDLTKG
jgi:hypothetical protein